MIALPTVIGRASLRYAEAADLERLAAEIGDSPEAEMICWHLVAIGVDSRTDIHTLGWMHGDVYITSPLRAWDQRDGIIRTRSGRVYQLGWRGDDADMHPALVRHLMKALVSWRYATSDEVWRR